MMTLWSNAVSQPGDTIELSEIVNSIRNGDFTDIVQQLRSMPDTTKEEHDARQEFKRRNFPAFTPAELKGNYRGNENLVSAKWLLFDADSLEPTQLTTLRQELERDPEIGLAFTSPSGEGVKFGCRLVQPITDHIQFSRVYEHWREVMEKRFRVRLDPSCKNAERICYFSCDSTIHEKASVPLDVNVNGHAPTSVTNEIKRPKLNPEDRDKIVEALGELHPDQDYDTWCNVGMALNHWHVVDGLPLWVEWSARGAKYKAGECEKKWQSFKPKTDGKAVSYIFWLVKEQQKPPSLLPKIISATALKALKLTPPPMVIAGVLHQGHKCIFGAPSKARKSWVTIDLAIAVASGQPWLDFPTVQGPVLYIDYELDQYFTDFRIEQICTARNIPRPELLDVWSLRGHNCPVDQLLPEIQKQVGGKKYSLIIPDPIYKTQAGRDENSAGEMSLMLLEIERLAKGSGAAVFYADHYAKGNAAAKEVLDRISGSGVKARGCDTSITMTPHEADDLTFTVDIICRNFSPVDPFVCSFEFPSMVKKADLNPEDLKTARSRSPKVDKSLMQVREALNQPMTSSEWQKKCEDVFDIKRRTFFTRKGELINSGIVVEEAGKWKCK